jgi:hypothetical protein
MASFETTYDEGMEAYREAPDKAEAEIIKMGLSVSTRPIDRRGEFEDLPRLPFDLSQATFPQLQQLIGKFTEWYGYAIGQQKQAEGLRNSAEKQRTFAWARIRKTKTGTVSDKDDATRLDRRYVDADAYFEFRDAQYRMLVGIVEGLKRDIETISRAASVLESRMGAEGKGVGLGRKGRPDSTPQENRSSVLNKFRRGRRR